MKTAIIFGASGNIGNHLLQILLGSDKYAQLKIVTRKPIEIQHKKLISLIGDYQTLPKIKEYLYADDVFIILGSTDKDVERNYPVLIARLCKELNAETISIVTAVGASPKSALNFTKVKGEIEQDILKLNYQKTNIFRPGMITGERQAYRPFEKTMMRAWKAIDPILRGGLSKYRGMQARKIAFVMFLALDSSAGKVNVFHWNEMHQIIKTAERQ